MFSLIVARGVLSAIKALESPLEKLRTLTDIWVGQQKQEARTLIKLELFVTEEEFDRIAQHADVEKGWREARFLKNVGAVH